MSIQVQNIGTKIVTNTTYVIDGDEGWTAVSLVLVGGNATFRGSEKVEGAPSDPLPLSNKEPLTVSSGSPRPLDGLTIDATTGTVHVILRK